MIAMPKFELILETILTEELDDKYTSAVAIVQCRDRWLLGLARNTDDDRTGKWVHPGGHIKRGEDPKKAAERECYEETGIKCKAVDEPFRIPNCKNVAFVHCKATTTNQKIRPNHEFSAVGFFSLQEIRSLKPIYKNAKKLIERVR